MKGFTLIETLVYIAVSTIITTSLVSLFFTLASSEKHIGDIAQQETAGLTALKITRQLVQNKRFFDQSEFMQTYELSDFSISTSSNLANISFKIFDQNFSQSFYVEP